MKITAPLPMDIRLMNAASKLLLAAGVLMCLAATGWWLARHPVFALQAITVPVLLLLARHPRLLCLVLLPASGRGRSCRRRPSRARSGSPGSA